MADNIPAVPGSEENVLPPAPDMNAILNLIAVALSKLPGADGFTIMKAHAVMDSQFSKGFNRGRDRGFQDGYDRGYNEGFQDGQREALDKTARKEAEQATLRAAVRAKVKR